MASFVLLKSINRLHGNKTIYQNSKRTVSYLLTKLNDRKLIRINGTDSYDYMQGLVTNDIRHLESTTDTSVTLDCIYSFMLNVLGRVVSDLFIYKSNYTNDDKQLLVEVDSSLLNSTAKFLNAYRVRRKVKIDIENRFQVWALFPSKFDMFTQVVEEKADHTESFECFKNEDMIVVKDPRLKELGFRLLVNTLDNSDEKVISHRIESLLKSNNVEFSETDVNQYHKYRYQLGIGEGVKDFPVESCFPLECNADYLHGVSFHKGCYVGQELTARIKHTGVIRKRLMPIEIISDKEIPDNIPIQNICTNEGKNVGRFRSHLGKYGLSLLRFEDVFKANELTLSETGLKIKAYKPFWWPKELSRDSISCGRTSH